MGSGMAWGEAFWWIAVAGRGIALCFVLIHLTWDTKDRRDVARGSNTAIFEVRARWGREAR